MSFYVPTPHKPLWGFFMGAHGFFPFLGIPEFLQKDDASLKPVTLEEELTCLAQSLVHTQRQCPGPTITRTIFCRTSDSEQVFNVFHLQGS